MFLAVKIWQLIIIRKVIKSMKKDINILRKLSRSKIELYKQCQRCFYLDQKFGIKRPSGPAFTLNSAVDYLLKKEFDIHRAKGTSHPLLKKYGLKLVPLEHEKISEWRENFTGVQYFHPSTGFLIYGAIDDIWVDDKNTFYVVDYKATSTQNEIVLDDEYKKAYKYQMEIYQWLLRQNGFKVSDTGYFVFCNGKKDRQAFDGRLEFDVTIIPYKGDSSWVSKDILKIYKLLKSKKIPAAAKDCEFCKYREVAQKVL